jgi:hypothetical protein
VETTTALLVDGCRFERSAAYSGGSLYLDSVPEATISNCVFNSSVVYVANWLSVRELVAGALMEIARSPSRGDFLPLGST